MVGEVTSEQKRQVREQQWRNLEKAGRKAGPGSGAFLPQQRGLREDDPRLQAKGTREGEAGGAGCREGPGQLPDTVHPRP